MLRLDVLTREWPWAGSTSFKFSKDLFLQIHTLDGGFDDHIGVLAFFNGENALDASESGILLFSGDLALFGHAGEIFGDPGQTLLDELHIDVAKVYVVASLCRHLGDTGSHCACADYKNFHCLPPGRCQNLKGGKNALTKHFGRSPSRRQLSRQA